MAEEKKSGPRVIVEQLSGRRAASPGEWLVAWRIDNRGEETLRLLSGRLPHSRFRCEERELRAVPALPPNESARLEFPLRCAEPPGTIVENGFLILTVLWREEPWRILARLRISIDREGAPQAATELITTQRVGFSMPMKREG